jgi:hypothetical protein
VFRDIHEQDAARQFWKRISHKLSKLPADSHLALQLATRLDLPENARMAEDRRARRPTDKPKTDQSWLKLNSNYFLFSTKVRCHAAFEATVTGDISCIYVTICDITVCYGCLSVAMYIAGSVVMYTRLQPDKSMKSMACFGLIPG